jgi:hypothetical protein
LVPNHGYNNPYTATSWDDNGDSILSVSDQIILEGADGFYFDYHIDRITATLNLTQLPFTQAAPPIWFADITDYGLGYLGTPYPAALPGTPASQGGGGNYDMTGNFTNTGGYYASINSITADFRNGTVRTLNAGTEYQVYPGTNQIEILVPLDHHEIGEYFIYGANGTPVGWPAPKAYDPTYCLTGVQGIDLNFPNGTARAATGGEGYPSPLEWWYMPDYPSEFQAWYATWPSGDNATTGTEYWIDYTLATLLTVDFNAIPDPNPRYLDFNGTYADFLALVDPVNSTWDEIFPVSLRDYIIVGWDDNDASTDLSAGDKIYTDGTEGLIDYMVNEVNTNIYASRKPWICEDDPTDRYFGLAPIVTVAGFPHEDRSMCPWHNSSASVPLPHVVENGEYCAPFKPSGGFIDIWTQYPDPFGGQGAHKPSDMFWPQKEMHICANVTYAEWPEQNKDVAFQVIDPHGQTWGIYVNRTNTIGMTCVRVRLPWPCDDPDYYFGIWTVIATVDVACVVVNDTMQFKYDYKVHIWDVTLDKTEYKHCEDINVTINYGSWATQEYNITLAVTAVDASGVPFDFAYAVVTIGWNDHQMWCLYKNGTVTITVHCEKFARPPVGTIYVVALSDLPINGGGAETPVFEVQFTILPEWA